MQLVWTGPKELTAYEVDQINPVSGVYRISARQSDGELYIIYVGQTNDLHNRLRQYLNQDTDNGCLYDHLRNYTCYFNAAGVSRSEDRDACERALFDRYAPECNNPAGIPDVLPADINFD